MFNHGCIAINESPEHAIVLIQSHVFWLYERDALTNKFISLLVLDDSGRAQIIVEYIYSSAPILVVQSSIFDIREVFLGRDGPLDILVTQVSLCKFRV